MNLITACTGRMLYLAMKNLLLSALILFLYTQPAAILPILRQSDKQKNDMENALAGLQHAEYALNPEDFTAMKANWDNKDKNIEEIAEELNLGKDSFVFIDDNSAERAFVKGQIQGISMPEIISMENYIQHIDRGGYFEVTTLSEKDVSRNEMYQKNAERFSYENYEDYLKSLQMKAAIRNFDPSSLSRITQLINKTDQFNLTTKRHSEGETEQITSNGNYINLLQTGRQVRRQRHRKRYHRQD